MTYIPLRCGVVYLEAIIDWATRKVLPHGVSICMDGKGRWVDNVPVERLWKGVKYEHVYSHAYDSVAGARDKPGTYLDYYNRRRSHSSLDRQAPGLMHFNTQHKVQAT